MIDTWSTITATLGLCTRRESDVHPHAPEECAELFHAADGGGTEWEYLNLLFALVIACKPQCIIETGTANGFGTLALAAAAQANGIGRIITVDTGECQQAKGYVEQFRLTERVHFVRAEAFAHCATTEDAYDFGFFDSDVSCRHRECDVLIRRKKICGLATFHDASSLRFAHGSNFEMVQWIEARAHTFFPLSRGFALIKL
jgi:predicted O-methyltransferase YrrM